jgi:hypothetical protein
LRRLLRRPHCKFAVQLIVDGIGQQFAIKCKGWTRKTQERGRQSKPLLPFQGFLLFALALHISFQVNHATKSLMVLLASCSCCCFFPHPNLILSCDHRVSWAVYKWINNQVVDQQPGKLLIQGLQCAGHHENFPVLPHVFSFPVEMTAVFSLLAFCQMPQFFCLHCEILFFSAAS